MYLGIDIGGTKTLIALFTKRGRIIKRKKFRTPHGSKTFLKQLLAELEPFRRRRIRRIVIAVPGAVQNNCSAKLSNREWGWVDIATPIKDLFKCPIWLENDANLATLYESTGLSGKVIYLTFSTGIGGGIVENIFIRDISMTDIKTDAITFNMYYGGKSVAEMLADGDNPDNTTKMPVTEETPIFRNIDIQDIVCNGAGRAMEFNGLPEMPIRNINLKNIVIKAKKDAEFTNYENVTKENVNITIE